MMKVRGVRGATTVSKDSSEAIHEATLELLKIMIADNDILNDDIASAFFSLSPDLHSSFPAKAARELPQWQHVPLFCAQELDITDALPKCIRIMIHWNTEKNAKDIKHTYLREAQKLRPDLRSKN